MINNLNLNNVLFFLFIRDIKYNVYLYLNKILISYFLYYIIFNII